MRTIFLLLLIFFCSVASVFAKPERLTKEEFLSRIDNGTVTLDRSPIMSIPPGIQKKVTDKIKQKYPNFKDHMWYFCYIKDNNFMYSLFFDWTLNACILRIEELDKKTGKPTEKTLDLDGQRVKKSYCDKVYGVEF